MILPDYPPPGERRNYPKPDFEGTSLAQREARDFSNSFNYGVAKNKPLTVAIIGGMFIVNLSNYDLLSALALFLICQTPCQADYPDCRQQNI